MEFNDVVRRRRMVRRYDETPVPREVLDRVLINATRGPSAGFAQGWAFLVLDTPDARQRYWLATAGRGRLEAPDRWLRGMMTAPVLIIPCSHERAYRDRYAEPDKAGVRAADRWHMPYWHLDTAMASLLALLTAVDEGLGACFFGIPAPRVEDVHREFSIPTEFSPIGVISLGYRHNDPGAKGSATRPRRPLAEVVHRGSWGAQD